MLAVSRSIAILFLFSVFKLSAQDSTRWLLQAQFYLDNNNFSKALDYIDSIPNKNYYVHFVEGNVFYIQKDYKKAIVFYRLCNRQKKDFAYFQIAKTYASIHQPDSVLIALRKHLQSSYKKQSNVIETEAVLDSFRASKYWDKLALETYYSPDERTLEQAIYYQKKGEVSLALDIVDELISDDKTNAEAYFNRAKFIVDFNEDYKYAISDLKQAIKIDNQKYEYFHLLAHYYFLQMKYKKSLLMYLSAHRLFPYSLKDYFYIARAYYRMGDYEKAIQYINKYTAVDNRNIDALLLAGQIYYDKGDNPSSIFFLTRAINENSRRADVLVARGKSYLENDEYQRAGRDFNIALDLDTKNGEIWYLKGLAFLYQERRDEACKYFKKASYLNYYRADEYLLKECQ